MHDWYTKRRDAGLIKYNYTKVDKPKMTDEERKQRKRDYQREYKRMIRAKIKAEKQ